MTATTDHYLGIDVHKRQAQVAVLDDEGTVVEEIRVANADLDEVAEKYAGSRAAIEAGSNYFTIYDRLDEELDVTLANPAKADWLQNQKLQKWGQLVVGSKRSDLQWIVVEQSRA